MINPFFNFLKIFSQLYLKKDVMHSVKTFLWESSKRIIIFVSKYLHTALPIQNVKKTIPAMWNLLLVCTVFNELINKNFKIQGFYWFMSYNFRTIYYWIMNEYKYWLIIVSVFVFSIWTIAQGRTLFFSNWTCTKYFYVFIYCISNIM